MARSLCQLLGNFETFQEYLIPKSEAEALKELMKITGIRKYEKCCSDYENATSQYARIEVKDKHVTKLQIIGYKLEKLPKRIVKLKELEELDLCNNQLTQIPAEIGRLKKLEHLNLAWNQITQLSYIIFKPKKLWDVHLQHNKIKNINDSV